MKHTFTYFSTLLTVTLIVAYSCAYSQTATHLIPKPESLVVRDGEYMLPVSLPVHSYDMFLEFTELLNELPGVDTVVAERVRSERRLHDYGVRLIRAKKEHGLDQHAYRLDIDSSGVKLIAHEASALLYGIATLRQLGYLHGNNGRLPYVSIEDKPRFEYRGLHLDVSRHFFPLSFVKKLIDIMSIYKFNTFHWHLTDGAGWRLAINQYPKLTTEAAWRTHTDWATWRERGSRFLPFGHPNANGGFYTQDEARELVAYAAKRGVNVIPEIEMPGHSEAALAAYPNLSCSGEPYGNSDFCLGNEDTYTFLTGVLEEVLDVFPSEYIHIGGDEAQKSSWRSCEKCQALMEREGLEDVDALQSYAVKRVNEYLKERKRKLIGWDEILEGGLAEGATVMSWRGESGGVKAANAGHDVVMTPESHLYFDHYQSNPQTQPRAIGGYTPIQKVYAYEPIPEGINKDKVKHILGAQANTWTEYIPTRAHAEYMIFPRAIALAEVLWSAESDRSWEDFFGRLQQHYAILQHLRVNYYRPSYDVTIAVRYDPEKQVNIFQLSSEQFPAGIRYTTDGTDPDANSPLYTRPFELSVPATVKAVYVADSTVMGNQASQHADIHKAIGKKVEYANPWYKYPAQEEATLTNGQKGGLTYHDGEWQGFIEDLDVTIDFERREEINSLALRFMQLKGPGVLLPSEVKVLLSDNGKNFREVASITHEIPKDDPALIFHTFETNFESPYHARYVRVIAKNTEGFIFTDEIVVY